MNIVMPEFLGCPFCGNQPKIEIQVQRWESDGVWAWLRCNCFEMPQHRGVHRSTFSQKNYPYGPSTRYRSDEAAAQDAVNDLARYWNTRAPINAEEVE
jgi:hypothetical protein